MGRSSECERKRERERESEKVKIICEDAIKLIHPHWSSINGSCTAGYVRAYGFAYGEIKKCTQHTNTHTLKHINVNEKKNSLTLRQYHEFLVVVKYDCFCH